MDDAKTEHLQEVVRIGYTAWSESRQICVSRSPREALQNQPWFQNFFKIKCVFDLIDDSSATPPRITTTGFRVHSLMTFKNILQSVFGTAPASAQPGPPIVAMWHPTEYAQVPASALSVIFARHRESFYCFNMRGYLRAQMTKIDSWDSFLRFVENLFEKRDTTERGTVTVLDKAG